MAENKGVERGNLPDSIARRFVEARLAAQAIFAFPGPIPSDLAAGYRNQEAAIDQFPDHIAGWKIGRVGPEFEDQFGRSRIAGPIFARSVRRTTGAEPMPFPVFRGGFAAVEAEFVFVLARDAPATKQDWTLDEARDIAGAMHVGIETAGSPLATINELGPAVVVTDFGNNAGLILGPEVSNWRSRADDALRCETFVDGICVGRGAACELPGGPLEALRFILDHCARRGRPLKAGMLISTGAATGIHDIGIGQTARAEFAGIGRIECVAVAAHPSSEGNADLSRAARA